MRIIKYIFCAILFVGVASADTINIDWMDRGTTYAQTTCEIGGDLILPTTPTRRGYTFAGWNTNRIYSDGVKLPVEYDRLEYIKSTGTQYIDTGIVTPDSASTVTMFSAKVAYTSNAGSERQFIGLYNNGSVAHYCEIKSGKYGVNATGGYYSPDLTANTAYNVTMQVNGSENTSYNINIDGIDYSKTVTQYQATAMGRFYLFGSPAVDRFSPSKALRIYSAKLAIDGNIVRNFIPAKRLSDSVIGMYDTVTKQFFTNAGTGEFIAGPVVYE